MSISSHTSVTNFIIPRLFRYRLTFFPKTSPLPENLLNATIEAFCMFRQNEELQFQKKYISIVYIKIFWALSDLTKTT